MRKVDVNKLSHPGFHRLEKKLYLRCYQGGSRAYVHRHRNYWILIGDFHKLDIDDAEAINDAIHTALARGYDVDKIRSKIAILLLILSTSYPRAKAVCIASLMASASSISNL